MEEKDEYQMVCPHCGYVVGTPPKESYHIKPGEILHKKYIVGRVLGYGGFGITYIAWDYALGRKVAIKEFLPSDFATRTPGETVVTVYNGEPTRQFEAGLERFMEEAQRLAKFNSMGSIVDIYDTFIENSTGYIVMQCLEGDTVKELIEKNGVMPYESARLIIIEVLKTLSAVHKEGIIHRDISPDNIFITNDNKIKLLDFGAARYASGFHSKSLSVILKPGYAPEEQYRSHGNQGPWSDVYATSATLYKMITGITIEEAMERTVKDNVKSPRELGVDLPEGANIAIMNALNIHAELRTRSADDFINELASEEVERVIDKPIKTDSGKMPLWLKISIPSVLAIALLLVTLVGVGVISVPDWMGGDAILADLKGRVPAIINKNMTDGKVALAKENLIMQIIGQDYDEYVDKDIIKTQSPASGRSIANDCYFDETRSTYMVYVVVSGGPSPKLVPNVAGLTLEEAKTKLAGLGFLVETAEEYSQEIPAGFVISQDIVDQEMDYGSTLHLIVSKGEMQVEESEKHKMPNLVGLSYDKAYQKLTAIGMYVTKKEQPSQRPENEVLSQSVKEGTECSEGTRIILTASKNTIIIPNVQYKEKNAAKQMIEGAGAKVKIEEVHSDTVAPGFVISQSVTGKATAGTTVTLTVSKGEQTKAAEQAKQDIEQQKKTAAPTPVVTAPPIVTATPVPTIMHKTITVPNVAGKSFNQAKSDLNRGGLNVRQQEEVTTNKNQSGKVIRTVPAAGQLVEEGTQVTVIVGKYQESAPKQVIVPNVVSKILTQAKSTLNQAGLNAVEQYEITQNPDLHDRVIRTSPGSGTSVASGSTITVVIGQYVEPAPQKVVIPNVAGKTMSVAQNTLEKSGFRVELVYEEVTSARQEMLVLRTNPIVGTTVSYGSTVTIVVGHLTPIQPVVIPNVAGYSYDDAKSKLSSLGLSVKKDTQTVTNKSQDGKVLRTTPGSGASVNSGSSVTIVVGIYQAPQPTKVTVPNVVGQSADMAQTQLRGYGLKVTVAYEAVYRQNDNGKVLESRPAANSSVDAGSNVTIIVGKLQTVSVPNVMGKTESAAKSTLGSNGFTVNSREATVTEKNKNGVVISMTPSGGQNVAYGSSVDIVIGRYEAPKKTVPYVTGDTLNSAKRTLEDMGFEVWVEERTVTKESQNGVVLSTSPASGKSVDIGSTVTVVVGKINKVNVPDVLAQSPERAQSNLEKNGFKVKTEYETVTDEWKNGTVIETRPEAGESVTSGSTVTIVVGKYKNTPKAKIPDVMGMPQQEAEATLREAGFVPHVKAYDDERWVNPVVIEVEPWVGNEIPMGSPVTITVK